MFSSILYLNVLYVGRCLCLALGHVYIGIIIIIAFKLAIVLVNVLCFTCMIKSILNCAVYLFTIGSILQSTIIWIILCVQLFFCVNQRIINGIHHKILHISHTHFTVCDIRYQLLYFTSSTNNFHTATKWCKLLKAFHVGTIKNKVIRPHNTATAIFMSKPAQCTEINKNAM